MKNKWLFFLLILIIKPAVASPACEKLITFFQGDYTQVKLDEVRTFMNSCLIQAQDNDYTNHNPQDFNQQKPQLSLTQTTNQKASCQNKNSRSFIINPAVKLGTIKIRERTSTQDLTRFMNNTEQHFDPIFQKLHTQGLMYANLGLKIEPEIINISTFRAPNTIEFCQYITKINYEIGYDDLLVYISQDTKKQSCEYYFTLRHELIHALIGRQVLLEQIALINNQIKEVFRNRNFYYQTAQSPEQIKEQEFASLIADQINNEILLPVQNKISEELKIRNNQFDYEEFKNREARLNYFCSARAF